MSGNPTDLKYQLQTELDRAWRTKREDAGAYADPNGVCSRVVRAVYRTGAAREYPTQDVPGYVEVRKVEQIIGADAGLNRQLMLFDVYLPDPGQTHIKCLQPSKPDFARRR